MQSRLIVEVLRRYIDRAKTAVIQRGYRFLEGSLMLMEGDGKKVSVTSGGVSDYQLSPPLKLKHGAYLRELHMVRNLNTHTTERVDDLSNDGGRLGIILFHFI